MAKNITRDTTDGVILVTNTATARTAGDLAVIGGMGVLFLNDELTNATGCPVVARAREISYDKLTTDVVTVGAALYFDATNDRLTLIPGAHRFAGRAATAAGNGVTTVKFNLNEGPLPAGLGRLKLIPFAGADSTSAIVSTTCTGAVVGDLVRGIMGHVTANTGTHTFLVPVVGTDFEATITIVDKIQQQIAAGNLSANNYLAILEPAGA